jgi:hypothetical protein
MTGDLLAEPLQIKNGELEVREAPGLGIELDHDKLAAIARISSKEPAMTAHFTELDAAAAGTGANAITVLACTNPRHRPSVAR